AVADQPELRSVSAGFPGGYFLLALTLLPNDSQNTIPAHRNHLQQSVTVNIRNNRLSRTGYRPYFVSILAAHRVNFTVASWKNKFFDAIAINVGGDYITCDWGFTDPFVR